MKKALIVAVLLFIINLLLGCDNNEQNDNKKALNQSVSLRANLLPLMTLDKNKIGFLDGDTLEYDFNNNGKIEDPEENIRLMGYDAPENGAVGCLRLIGDQEPYATIVLNSVKNVILNAST